MEQFELIPGRPPRKVVVDRARKLFSSLNLEDLLLELGINYDKSNQHSAEWLPLEPFDDTEYDCRMPEEWLALGKSADGKKLPVLGQGLSSTSTGTIWRPIIIVNYDLERERYSGYWDDCEKDIAEYVELARINLCFNAEDPRIFAQRVA